MLIWSPALGAAEQIGQSVVGAGGAFNLAANLLGTAPEEYVSSVAYAGGTGSGAVTNGFLNFAAAGLPGNENVFAQAGNTGDDFANVALNFANWLGHSSYVLTLTTYADYIPEQEVENPLPEPVAAVPDTSVVSLFG